MQIQKIKGLIKGEGYTLEDYARNVLGVSYKTLSLWFKNGVIGSDYMETMIKTLHINDPAWIFFDMKVTYKDTSQEARQ